MGEAGAGGSERAELQAREAEVQGVIERFAATGYNQDIEIRIRLARYFATVSEAEHSARWLRFLNALEEERHELQELFDRHMVALFHKNA
jgi:hypothetical protein